MHDEPTNGALPLALVADIQEGLVAACNDLDRLRDLLDDAFGSLLAILPLEQSPTSGDARTAVTSMQFHDLGVQLIAHTRKRLQYCADRLAQDAFGADDEADIKAGKISVSSPIARALIGRSVGDTAEVRAPSGVRELEILDVRYE